MKFWSAALCRRLGMRQEAQFYEACGSGEWSGTAVYGVLDGEWAGAAGG
jgi:hypothetical protein